MFRHFDSVWVEWKESTLISVAIYNDNEYYIVDVANFDGRPDTAQTHSTAKDNESDFYYELTIAPTANIFSDYVINV